MKKFMIKMGIFIFPLIIFLQLYPQIAPKIFKQVFGMSTKEQIDKSFELVSKNNYDIIILGNSRIYRGINPEKFSRKAFNFGHDNDSFNQIYYKLLWLKKNDIKYKYLIIGVDYFQFGFLSDTRNYVYKDYFDKRYLEDFNNEYLSGVIDNKIKNWLELRKRADISMFCKYLAKKALGKNIKESDFVVKDSGQFRILPEPVAKIDDSVKRDGLIRRLKIQEKYFDMIVDFALKESIPIYFLMPPMRSNELKLYTSTEMKEFNEFILSKSMKYNDYYFNYSERKEFQLQDFMDITHLNTKGSNKFSEMIDDEILKIYVK